MYLTDDRQFVTPEVASEKLGVSTSEVHAMISDGRLSATHKQFGAGVLVHLVDVKSITEKLTIET